MAFEYALLLGCAISLFFCFTVGFLRCRVTGFRPKLSRVDMFMMVLVFVVAGGIGALVFAFCVREIRSTMIAYLATVTIGSIIGGLFIPLVVGVRKHDLTKHNDVAKTSDLDGDFMGF